MYAGRILPFRSAIPIRAIADVVGWGKPPFVAERNHVLRVEALDVLRNLSGPVEYDIRTAAVASRFVLAHRKVRR